MNAEEMEKAWKRELAMVDVLMAVEMPDDVPKSDRAALTQQAATFVMLGKTLPPDVCDAALRLLARLRP